MLGSHEFLSFNPRIQNSGRMLRRLTLLNINPFCKIMNFPFNRHWTFVIFITLETHHVDLSKYSGIIILRTEELT